MNDQPLSYWIAVARMGFEDDFNRLFDELGISRVELAKRVEASPAYVSKVLNGAQGNFQLSTMAKWARAIGAIVQIRLIKEGKEAVRVVDYETAAVLDAKSMEPLSRQPAADIVDLAAYRRRAEESAHFKKSPGMRVKVEMS